MNVVQKHLARVGRRTVVPTERILRYWWDVLDTLVFDGAVPQPIRVSIRASRNTWAEVKCREPVEHPYRCDLFFDSAPITRTGLLAVLVHEMVHAYEWAHGFPPTHGKLFYSWRDTILAVTGLPLVLQYSVASMPDLEPDTTC